MAEYRDTKTFVVAWSECFDHILHQEIVQALHEYHAIELSKQDIFELDDLHKITKLNDLKLEAFYRGSRISVIEIKPE